MLAVERKPWIVDSLRDVSTFFNVGFDTIRKEWVSRGMPGEHGNYDLSAIYHWKSQRPRDPNNADLIVEDEVKRRTKHAEMLAAEEDARAKKLKNDENEGHLVVRADVRRQVVEWAVRVRTRIMSLPDRVAAIVPGEMKATVKKMASELVRVVLKEAFDSELASQSIEDMVLVEAERIREQRQPS